jgi:two-component system, response regulator PdtaR
MKVLIVDDEALVRRSLRRVFEMGKHEVREAHDGQVGLKLWRESPADLVILDVLMPGLTGPQMLKEMGRDHGAKVILISAYTGEYSLTKARDVGADLFISKPFENVFDIVKKAESLIHSSQELTDRP